MKATKKAARPRVSKKHVLGAEAALAIQLELAKVANLLVSPLSQSDVRRLGKMPGDGAPLAQKLIKVGHEVPEALPPTVDVAALARDLARVEDLRTLQHSLEVALRRVGDTAFVEESALWKSVMDIYVILQRQARLLPQLQSVVDDVAAFMARGPRAPKTPEPVAAAPSVNG